MPRRQGISGEPGDAGLHEWSQYGFRPGVEVLLPEGVPPGWSGTTAWTGEPAELDPLGAGGRFGRPGGTLAPDVSRTSEDLRLSGPLQFVPRLLKFWRLEETDAVALLGFGREEAGYVASALAGEESFHGRDVRERIAHLFWIRKTLSALFRDQDTENAWLRETHSWLDDKAPLDLLRGGSMEDLLLVRDYVDTAAGV